MLECQGNHVISGTVPVRLVTYESPKEVIDSGPKGKTPRSNGHYGRGIYIGGLGYGSPSLSVHIVFIMN